MKRDSENNHSFFIYIPWPDFPLLMRSVNGGASFFTSDAIFNLARYIQQNNYELCLSKLEKIVDAKRKFSLTRVKKNTTFYAEAIVLFSYLKI